MNNIEGFLIVEDSSVSSLPQILADNNRSVMVEVVLQEAETPNRNGRIYARDALFNALNGPMIQEKLAKKTFYGEAGHPLSDDVKRQAYIDQSNISHIITKFNFDKNLIRGIVETANTRAGSDMKGLIRQGSQVAFSMRGLGNVIKEEGSYKRVCDPLMIISYDWVVFPSHPNAYMQKKLTESTAYYEREVESLNENANPIITFDMRQLLQYVTETSQQVKTLSENFEMEIKKDMSNVSLDQKNKMLSIKEGNDVLKVFLENSIKNELDSYFKNL